MVYTLSVTTINLQPNFMLIYLILSCIGHNYDLYAPADRDGDRDQVSIILLHKHIYNIQYTKEVTSDIITFLHSYSKLQVPVAKG